MLPWDLLCMTSLLQSEKQMVPLAVLFWKSGLVHSQKKCKRTF